MIPDLRLRRREAELMDEPGLDLRQHRHALTALGRANLVSRTTASLWPAICQAARAARAMPIRVVDVASGGGHVALSLARRANREGLALDIVGYDFSPVAIEYARTLAERTGVEGVRFENVDALHGSWTDSVDIAICTLFLHHLEEADAVSLLQRMKSAARRLVLVSDLRRSSTGYLFAWAGCRLLSRSRVFHVDGTRSVRAAFTPAEAELLAVKAGLHGARVTTRWPQRWLLAWIRT